MKRAVTIAVVIGLGLLGAWFCLKRRAAGAPEAQSVRQLVRDARDAGQEKRLAAVQALGQLADRRATTPLETLAQDKDPRVAQTARQALRGLAGQGAISHE
jgi:HEAT repeat protein